MIRQIASQFFTTDIPGTLAYYKNKLGFECLAPIYAIVARNQHAIHFRCAEAPTANPEKYADELLDAYLFVEDADRASCRVRIPGRGVRSGTCQHAMALARVCGQGLRRPSAGLRFQLIAAFCSLPFRTLRTVIECLLESLSRSDAHIPKEIRDAEDRLGNSAISRRLLRPVFQLVS
jgi:hypothetical protein